MNKKIRFVEIVFVSVSTNNRLIQFGFLNKYTQEFYQFGETKLFDNIGQFCEIFDSYFKENRDEEYFIFLKQLAINEIKRWL